MRHTRLKWIWAVLIAVVPVLLIAQTIPTTTVQGTVYQANGEPCSGTVLVSWPAFTTAANQQVAAGSTTVTVGADGFLSVNLAANLGSNPAGLYYTAVFHLSDGTVSTQYWVVPARSRVRLEEVRAQSMPQDDLSSRALSGNSSYLPLTGGTMTGPIVLSADPTAPMQATDKEYVDESFAQTTPLSGATMTGGLNAPAVNGTFAPTAGTSQITLQATQTAAAVGGSMVIPGSYSGTDTFTNTQGIRVEDLRASGAQQHERSVKEFGAVCDGVTNDTAALQAAINYAQTRMAVGQGIALVLPAGVCKTNALQWHGESISGQGRQVSALMGYPGQDVLATLADSATIASNTHLHDFTIYVDQSVDVSCSPAEGRAAAGACGVSRPVASGSVIAPGGNGLTGVAGTGAGWSIGNCGIAMPAVTGTGGNGLKGAVIENLEITAVGADPLGAYNQADSTHTCGIYLAQWPQLSEFRNISISGVGTGIAIPAVAAATALGVTADSNTWQNVAVSAVHGFAAQAGSQGVLDNVQVNAWNSAAAGEAPTGLVLDFPGGQQGWTVRNAVVAPAWYEVAPKLTITASGGAVTAVVLGLDHGLGFEAYGPTVPLLFSGSCTASATAVVNSDGSLGAVTVASGGVGCSGTTTASVNVSGTAMPGKPVNLIAGTQMSFLGGNLLKGVGGYTVWNAASSRTAGTQMGGGGTLTASTTAYPALVVGASAETGATAAGDSGSANKFEGLTLAGAGSLLDGGLGNTLTQTAANGVGVDNLEPTRLPGNTISADFALLGGGTSSQDFTSLNDLMFSAEDLYLPGGSGTSGSGSGGESVAAGSLFGKDSAAPVTGSYVKAVGGAWDTSGVFTLRGTPNFLNLGNNFPVGSGTWVVAAKADAAGTQELKLLGSVGSGPSSSCVFADQVLSLTTGWQVFRIPYNTVTGVTACDSASAGNPVTAEGLAPSVSTNVYTAFMAFVPAFQQLLIANQPTVANQAANKAYVDAAVAAGISGGGGGTGGALPIAGGTLTGPLYAPAIDGTTDCALTVAGGGTVAGCVSSATSALIPPGVTGTYTQYGSAQATAQCTYNPQTGAITAVMPGQLGIGYTSAPAVTVTAGSSGGTGLTVTANVSGGQVTSYAVTHAGTGYTSCPALSVAAPAAAATPIPVLDERKGVNSYSADVRVDDFGCAGDGVTDDTPCFNDAIQCATAGGTRTGSVTLTQGKNYYIATITGYMQTAWDDGTVPTTDTCGGVACTAMAPETPGYLGYAIKVPSSQTTPLTIYGNGATITSSFSTTAAGAATYTLAAPYFALFGSDGTITSWNLFDVTINHAFIGAATKSAAYWRWDRVSMNSVGVVALLGSSQYESFRDMFVQSAESGFVIGGWWGSRAPWTSTTGQTYLNAENLGDATLLDSIVFYGLDWTTQSQGQVAQNALDTWFNTYFFHVGDNSTRLTDQDVAYLGAATDSLWRGIYHVGFAMYSRYNRQVLNVIVHNFNVKHAQNHAIIATAPYNWTIDGLSTEFMYCNGTQSMGAYGSTGCPNPYDSVDNQLPGVILMYQFQNINAKGINEIGATPVEESIAEPPQVTAAQAQSDFRQQVTNLDSLVGSSIVPKSNPPFTSRLILQTATNSLAPGTTNPETGELCMKGANAGYYDLWCMRGEEQVYTAGFTMPRYLVLENDGYPGLTGQTAVQMPGLRVRPGAISGTDTTLPVTDFTSQAFAIAAGTVAGEACSTVPSITVGQAAVTDNVLFVKGPGSVQPLVLSGTVTAANTMSLTVCNPSTAVRTYPAGTYYAFLMAGAAAVSTPATTGGTPTATSPLTTSPGDIVAADSNGNPTRLAGNATTTPAVLTQTGTGAASATPAWSTAPALNGANITGLNGANITTGAVPIANGGTGASTALQALSNLGAASLNAAVSSFGGVITGRKIGAAYQVDQLAVPAGTSADIGSQLGVCLAGLSTAYGGICDARNYSGTVTMASNVTLNVPNTTILLPCATISTNAQFIVPAGIRNVTLKGCALRGASTASGSQGGTVIAYSGAAAAIQVGDPTYASDTMGFHLDDVVINTTGSTSSTTSAVTAYRTQELDLESLYLLGPSNQTGLVLDGTGNYTGGTFYDLEFNGWQTAVNGIGHQAANAATTDWMNASTFVRVHIDCPTASGSPVAGTFGINLQQGDGNTFTGGDVEGCATALHLGANAQNNTIVGLRNENSTNQVVADAGSSYNSWIAGGTMFSGELTDNGTRNSFLDTFHRTFNGVKGDWYQSQLDATVTNHIRVGTGTGNERGLLNEYQTDYGYRWTIGPGDGTSGEQFFNITDLLNNVNRLSLGQYLGTTSNSVTNVILNNNGCYTSATAPAITFSGGGGSGAAATATMGTTNRSEEHTSELQSPA